MKSGLFSFVFEKYGFKMQLKKEDKIIDFKGVIRPVKSVAKQNTDENFYDIGVIDENDFIFIGPMNIALLKEDEIIFKNKIYFLKNFGKVYADDDQFYYWGVVCKRN